MGKRTKEIVMLCILVILLCISLYLSYSIHLKINNIKNNIDKEQTSLKDKNDALIKQKNELEQLNKEIVIYKDIDTNIQKMKDEYFKKIKELEERIVSGESNEKIAYLTFDDGPYYNTYKVLDILDQYGVKATFFTISMNGEYCYDNKNERCFPLYKEYLKRGHTIANHTYTHGLRTGLYKSVDSFMDAVQRQEDHIKNQTEGYKTNILRFPGGSSTAKGLKNPMIEALQKKGYGWVDWTAGDGDGGRLADTDQAWGNLTRTINENIEVILFHDYSKITTALLPDFINYLRNEGYQLYPLFYDSVMIHK